MELQIPSSDLPNVQPSTGVNFTLHNKDFVSIEFSYFKLATWRLMPVPSWFQINFNTECHHERTSPNPLQWHIQVTPRSLYLLWRWGMWMSRIVSFVFIDTSWIEINTPYLARSVTAVDEKGTTVKCHKVKEDDRSQHGRERSSRGRVLWTRCSFHSKKIMFHIVSFMGLGYTNFKSKIITT